MRRVYFIEAEIVGVDAAGRPYCREFLEVPDDHKIVGFSTVINPAGVRLHNLAVEGEELENEPLVPAKKVAKRAAKKKVSKKNA